MDEKSEFVADVILGEVVQHRVLSPLPLQSI